MKSTDLQCMNCRTPTAADEADLFAEVFLCKSCHTQAVHFWQRIDRELRSLQVMAKDAIRVCLLEGRFSFPEGTGGEVSKREVLETILTMEEARDRQCQMKSSQSIPTPPSTETTQQLARAMAVPARASSRKGFLPG